MHFERITVSIIIFHLNEIEKLEISYFSQSLFTVGQGDLCGETGLKLSARNLRKAALCRRLQVGCWNDVGHGRDIISVLACRVAGGEVRLW